MQQHRSIQNRDDRQHRFPLWPLVLGLSVGFLGIHLFVVRPLTFEINKLRAEVAAVEKDMRELVGSKDQVWAATNLLSSLKTQHRRVADAREALKAIRTFRLDVQQEAVASLGADESLDRIHDVNQKVAEVDASARLASNTVNRFVELKDRVLAEREAIIETLEILDRTAQLNRIALDENSDVDEATQRVKQLVALQSQLLASTQRLPRTIQTAATLKRIVSDLLDQEKTSVAAEKTLERMTATQDKLAQSGEKSLAAKENLDALQAMQSQLARQSDEVADSVQTLELLADFRKEIRASVAQLDHIRRQLIEVSLLESTIERVAQLVEPLRNLADLRRLSPSEMRQAAQSILDQRSTRIANRPEDEEKLLPEVVEPQTPANEFEGLVPVPLDEEPAK